MLPPSQHLPQSRRRRIYRRRFEARQSLLLSTRFLWAAPTPSHLLLPGRELHHNPSAFPYQIPYRSTDTSFSVKCCQKRSLRRSKDIYILVYLPKFSSSPLHISFHYKRICLFFIYALTLCYGFYWKAVPHSGQNFGKWFGSSGFHPQFLQIFGPPVGFGEPQF